MPFAANGAASLLTDAKKPWVALHSGSVPSSTNEISFAGYERKQVTTWSWLAAAVRATIRTEAVATGRWTGIRSIGWWTAETGGTLIAYRNYATAIAVEVGDTFGFNAAGRELDVGVPVVATRTQGGMAAIPSDLARYCLNTTSSGFPQRAGIRFYSARPRPNWRSSHILALARSDVVFERSGNVIRNRDQIQFAAVSAQTAAPTHWMVEMTSYDALFYGQMAAGTPTIPANTRWAIPAHAISITL